MKNVIQIMPEFGLAGAERMCENLVYELLKTGNYNVIVVSLYDYHSSITEELENKGIKVFYLGKSKGFDFRIIFKLAHIMKCEHIDIVHTHRYVMQYAIPAAIISGVKTRIHTIHNVAHKEVDSLRQKLAYFFYKYCHVVPVSISPIVQKTVIERYGLEAEKTPIVYNGIDLNRCVIKNNYSTKDVFRFVHVGRFVPQKNHEIIIKAALKLKSENYKFEIFLVGVGGNDIKYQQQVHKLGLDSVVTFCGLQSDIYPFLSSSDCFILPSLFEGMPVTLIEAMGCAMPIIASNVGGIPDMIENDFSGLIIQPNTEDLVAAMKTIIANEALRSKLGKNALISSKKFSSENMCKGYLSLYIK